ncbi:DUF6655 family protein [Crateriforma conspicua]|uniref:Lipoprotein n=1 Tax=Crateriforma conspicua TaxID=2527996 RepID=A0A5C6FSF5_9PLAN|nr:DUF6655 family protein [Crateriforma conspicua]TWU65271.1 hypothetical protein V7x_08170 [Crateriforma conspicua]
MASPRRRRWVILPLMLSAAACGGCRSIVHSTDTSATGSQQLLLSSSVDSVVCSFDFQPLLGRRCYLDTRSLGAEKDGYVTYRIREQMISQGVRLVDSSDDADVVVEAGLAAYGTDSQYDDIGITDVDALPDVHLCIRGTQYGVAKLSMFAWEKESGAAIWHSGMMRADGYQEYRKCLGTGPYYSGTIQHSANRIDRARLGWLPWLSIRR